MFSSIYSFLGGLRLVRINKRFFSKFMSIKSKKREISAPTNCRPGKRIKASSGLYSSLFLQGLALIMSLVGQIQSTITTSQKTINIQAFDKQSPELMMANVFDLSEASQPTFSVPEGSKHSITLLNASIPEITQKVDFGDSVRGKPTQDINKRYLVTSTAKRSTVVLVDIEKSKILEYSLNTILGQFRLVREASYSQKISQDLTITTGIARIDFQAEFVIIRLTAKKSIKKQGNQTDNDIQSIIWISYNLESGVVGFLGAEEQPKSANLTNFEIGYFANNSLPNTLILVEYSTNDDTQNPQTTSILRGIFLNTSTQKLTPGGVLELKNEQNCSLRHLNSCNNIESQDLFAVFDCIDPTENTQNSTNTITKMTKLVFLGSPQSPLNNSYARFGDFKQVGTLKNAFAQILESGKIALFGEDSGLQICRIRFGRLKCKTQKVSAVPKIGKIDNIQTNLLEDFLVINSRQGASDIPTTTLIPLKRQFGTSNSIKLAQSPTLSTVSFSKNRLISYTPTTKSLQYYKLSGPRCLLNLKNYREGEDFILASDAQTRQIQSDFRLNLTSSMFAWLSYSTEGLYDHQIFGIKHQILDLSNSIKITGNLLMRGKIDIMEPQNTPIILKIFSKPSNSTQNLTLQFTPKPTDIVKDSSIFRYHSLQEVQKTHLFGNETLPVLEIHSRCHLTQKSKFSALKCLKSSFLGFPAEGVVGDIHYTELPDLFKGFLIEMVGPNTTKIQLYSNLDRTSKIGAIGPFGGAGGGREDRQNVNLFLTLSDPDWEADRANVSISAIGVFERRLLCYITCNTVTKACYPFEIGARQAGIGSEAPYEIYSQKLPKINYTSFRYTQDKELIELYVGNQLQDEYIYGLFQNPKTGEKLLKAFLRDQGNKNHLDLGSPFSHNEYGYKQCSFLVGFSRSRTQTAKMFFLRPISLSRPDLMEEDLWQDLYVEETGLRFIDGVFCKENFVLVSGLGVDNLEAKEGSKAGHGARDGQELSRAVLVLDLRYNEAPYTNTKEVDIFDQVRLYQTGLGDGSVDDELVLSLVAAEDENGEVSSENENLLVFRLGKDDRVLRGSFSIPLLDSVFLEYSGVRLWVDEGSYTSNDATIKLRFDNQPTKVKIQENEDKLSKGTKKSLKQKIDSSENIKRDSRSPGLRDAPQQTADIPINFNLTYLNSIPLKELLKHKSPVELAQAFYNQSQFLDQIGYPLSASLSYEGPLNYVVERSPRWPRMADLVLQGPDRDISLGKLIFRDTLVDQVCTTDKFLPKEDQIYHRDMNKPIFTLIFPDFGKSENYSEIYRGLYYDEWRDEVLYLNAFNQTKQLLNFNISVTFLKISAKSGKTVTKGVLDFPINVLLLGSRIYPYRRPPSVDNSSYLILMKPTVFQILKGSENLTDFSLTYAQPFSNGDGLKFGTVIRTPKSLFLVSIDPNTLNLLKNTFNFSTGQFSMTSHPLGFNSEVKKLICKESTTQSDSAQIEATCFIYVGRGNNFMINLLSSGEITKQKVFVDYEEDLEHGGVEFQFNHQFLVRRSSRYDQIFQLWNFSLAGLTDDSGVTGKNVSDQQGTTGAGGGDISDGELDDKSTRKIGYTVWDLGSKSPFSVKHKFLMAYLNSSDLVFDFERNLSVIWTSSTEGPGFSSSFLLSMENYARFNVSDPQYFGLRLETAYFEFFDREGNFLKIRGDRVFWYSSELFVFLKMAGLLFVAFCLFLWLRCWNKRRGFPEKRKETYGLEGAVRDARDVEGPDFEGYDSFVAGDVDELEGISEEGDPDEEDHLTDASEDMTL